MIRLLAAISLALAAGGTTSAAPATVQKRYFDSQEWNNADPSSAKCPPRPNRRPCRSITIPSMMITSPIAHMYITRKAYELYASQYDASELSLYIGDSANSKPDSDKNDKVVEGSYEEDFPRQDPWDQVIPELRHFWDCSNGPYAAWPVTTPPSTAPINIFRVATARTGQYDSGWSDNSGPDHGTKGQGIIFLYKHGNKAKAIGISGTSRICSRI